MPNPSEVGCTLLSRIQQFSQQYSRSQRGSNSRPVTPENMSSFLFCWFCPSRSISARVGTRGCHCGGRHFARAVLCRSLCAPSAAGSLSLSSLLTSHFSGEISARTPTAVNSSEQPADSTACTDSGKYAPPKNRKWRVGHHDILVPGFQDTSFLPEITPHAVRAPCLASTAVSLRSCLANSNK